MTRPSTAPNRCPRCGKPCFSPAGCHSCTDGKTTTVECPYCHQPVPARRGVHAKCRIARERQRRREADL